VSHDELTTPVACNPQAMSPEAWAAHQSTIRKLFGQLREASWELPDGYAVRFPADALPDVAAFVDGERRCCPFLTFCIEVPSAAAPITLRITGSTMVKSVIAAELLSAPSPT
jgi:hypothetical protein